MNNNPLNNLTASQLRDAAAIKDKIDALEKDLSRVLSGAASKPSKATPKPKSAKRKRTGKAKATAKQATPKAARKQAKKKRTLSDAARRKLSQMAKARWAIAKKQGKNRI